METTTRQPTARELRACGGSMEVWAAKQAALAAGAPRQKTPEEMTRAALVAQGGREWFSGDAWRVYFNEVKIGAGVATFYVAGRDVVVVSKNGCTEAAVRKFAAGML